MRNSRARNRCGKKACTSTLRLGSSSSSWRALVACGVGVVVSCSTRADTTHGQPPGPSAEPGKCRAFWAALRLKPSGGSAGGLLLSPSLRGQWTGVLVSLCLAQENEEPVLRHGRLPGAPPERRPQGCSASSVHSSHLRAPDSLGGTPGYPARLQPAYDQRRDLCSAAGLVGPGPLLGGQPLQEVLHDHFVAFGEGRQDLPGLVSPPAGRKPTGKVSLPGGALPLCSGPSSPFLPFPLPSPLPFPPSTPSIFPSPPHLLTSATSCAGGSQSAHTACEPARRKQLSPTGQKPPLWPRPGWCSSRRSGPSKPPSRPRRSLPRTGPSSLA